MDSGALFGTVKSGSIRFSEVANVHCITAMAFSICNMASVRCSVGVSFSEGLLWGFHCTHIVQTRWHI